jgi:hypothetical protein
MSYKPKDFPLDECAQMAIEFLMEHPTGTFHQKWTCNHCGERQTMAVAEKFFRAGICEECKQTSVIKECGFLVVVGGYRDKEA